MVEDKRGAVIILLVVAVVFVVGLVAFSLDDPGGDDPAANSSQADGASPDGQAADDNETTGDDEQFLAAGIAAAPDAPANPIAADAGR